MSKVTIINEGNNREEALFHIDAVLGMADLSNAEYRLNKIKELYPDDEAIVDYVDIVLTMSSREEADFRLNKIKELISKKPANASESAGQLPLFEDFTRVQPAKLNEEFIVGTSIGDLYAVAVYGQYNMYGEHFSDKPVWMIRPNEEGQSLMSKKEADKVIEELKEANTDAMSEDGPGEPYYLEYKLLKASQANHEKLS